MDKLTINMDNLTILPYPILLMGDVIYLLAKLALL